MSNACRVLTTVLLAGLAGCGHRREPATVPEPVAQPARSAETAAAVPSPADTGRRVSIREYQGSYTSGFEMSWFEPCGASPRDRMWWVTLTDQALAQRDSILKTVTARSTKGLYVRWRGTTSPRMPAGQMGRGSRYMLVTEILEIRPLPESGACTGRSA